MSRLEERGEILIWDVKKQKETTKPAFPKSKGLGNCENAFVFASDGLGLISGNKDGEINIWDIATGCSIQTIMAHKGSIRCLAISPDGSLVASAGIDRLVKIWNYDALNRVITP